LEKRKSTEDRMVSHHLNQCNVERDRKPLIRPGGPSTLLPLPRKFIRGGNNVRSITRDTGRSKTGEPFPRIQRRGGPTPLKTSIGRILHSVQVARRRYSNMNPKRRLHIEGWVLTVQKRQTASHESTESRLPTS